MFLNLVDMDAVCLPRMDTQAKSEHLEVDRDLRKKLGAPDTGSEGAVEMITPVNGHEHGLEELINKDSKLMHKAAETLSKHFWFVGLQENIPESIHCFQQLVANATAAVLARRAEAGETVRTLMRCASYFFRIMHSTSQPVLFAILSACCSNTGRCEVVFADGLAVTLSMMLHQAGCKRVMPWDAHAGCSWSSRDQFQHQASASAEWGHTRSSQRCP